jgi:hypothetical protein
MPDLDFDHRDGGGSLANVPTPTAAAKDILPAARLAAREKHGRVRMAFLGPFLPFLVQIIVQVVLPWLLKWLAKQDDPAAALHALSARWERDRDPEVSVGLAKAARGETGE